MKITALTHHGMGRAEDGTLWPRCLPGERIDSEGRILEPAPERVAPPCRHFRSCGGCSVQHASDDFVARWKAGILRQALSARGLDAPLRRAHVSPAAARRRAKFSARRSKKGAIVGFHARASEAIIEVPDCQILSPPLRASFAPLAELTRLAASRKSQLGLTVTQSEEGLDVHISGLEACPPETRMALTDWAQAHDIARLSLEGEVIVTRRTPWQKFGRARAVPPPGGFLQATEAGQAALTLSVKEALAGCRHLADLFCGSGTFSLPLAASAEVGAYESEAEAIAALDAAWRGAPGLHRIRARRRDLFRAPLSGEELAPFDGVLLDPPRAGAAAQIAALAEAGPARIAYVSCNPVSFARDAEVLAGAGYRLDWIDLVDQFRWSAHLELAACFTRM